jgi:Cobalamin biosynthesis protein CbiK, Co2+ chelatase
MNRLRLTVAFFLLCLLAGTALGAESKKAFMLAAFGTSTEASVTFDEMLPLVKEAFPDRKVVIPYTSSRIREKLNKEIADPAQKILSPAEMLARLKEQGYTDIAVASTIVFPGVEHQKLKQAVTEFKEKNRGVKVTYLPPMLEIPALLQPVVNSLKESVVKDAFTVVVTHGTHEGHPVEKNYRALAKAVAETYPNTVVASIEGIPSMEEAMKLVARQPQKEVRFVVFMFVAGDHAENDIAGEEEDSLFSQVKKMGKTPSIRFTETQAGARFHSLGLDQGYRTLLLNHYKSNIDR